MVFVYLFDRYADIVKKKHLRTVIPFTSVAEEIMRRYGVLNSAKPSDYILPYLVNCTTQKSIDNKIHDVTKRINKGLESISKNLHLWKLTTYHARHTYGAHAQSVFECGTTSEVLWAYIQSHNTSISSVNIAFCKGQE